MVRHLNSEVWGKLCSCSSEAGLDGAQGQGQLVRDAHDRDVQEVVQHYNLALGNRVHANPFLAQGITSFTLGVAGCVAAGLSPGTASPQNRGALVTFTASSTGCAAPQYQFWVLPPGGAWTSVRAYSSGTTWQLDSSKYAAGSLQVGVWAREPGSSSAYDSFFVTTYWISPPAGSVITPRRW